MKSSALITATGIITLFSAACAFAAEPSKVMAKLDPDKDGTIDLAEAQAGGKAVFAKINPDKDGTVDAKELGKRLDEAGLKAADPDNDGTLDEKEYSALVEMKFKAADPDNDGTIDEKELKTPAGKQLKRLIY